MSGAAAGDLIGEARGLLDGTPTSETWGALVALVDSCAPEQLGALVDFLEPQLTRWEARPTTHSRRGHGAQDAPDRRLGAALFWEKLRALPSTKGLEHLRFGHLDAETIGGVQGDHHLDALREVVIRQSFSPGDLIVTFLRSELAQGARSPGFEDRHLDSILSALDDPALMPALEELSVSSSYIDHVRQMIASPVARRAGRVNVGFDLWFTGGIGSGASLEAMILHMLDCWTRDARRGPAHLDVSGLEIDDRDPLAAHELAASALARAASSWRLPPGTQTMSFGRWYSEDLEERLALRGVAATR